MIRTAFLLILFAPILLAADRSSYPANVPPPPEAVPEPPDLPLPIESGKVLDDEEPEITIRRKGKKTIQEYRVNGVLYMVKIVPDIGPPYFLIDTDGDGNMNVRRSDLEKGVQVPQWVLFRW